jgi:hypothetical protein
MCASGVTDVGDSDNFQVHLKGHLFGYGGITVVKGTEFLRFDLMIRHI